MVAEVCFFLLDFDRLGAADFGFTSRGVSKSLSLDLLLDLVSFFREEDARGFIAAAFVGLRGDALPPGCGCDDGRGPVESDSSPSEPDSPSLRVDCLPSVPVSPPCDGGRVDRFPPVSSPSSSSSCPRDRFFGSILRRNRQC